MYVSAGQPAFLIFVKKSTFFAGEPFLIRGTPTPQKILFGTQMAMFPTSFLPKIMMMANGHNGWPSLI